MKKLCFVFLLLTMDMCLASKFSPEAKRKRIIASLGEITEKIKDSKIDKNNTDEFDVAAIASLDNEDLSNFSEFNTALESFLNNYDEDKEWTPITSNIKKTGALPLQNMRIQLKEVLEAYKKVKNLIGKIGMAKDVLDPEKEDDEKESIEKTINSFPESNNVKKSLTDEYGK